jgi:hypothetical protein
MSYDVNVGNESVNMTSNMLPLFVDFDVYPPDWHGRPRAVVGAEIGEGLRRITLSRDADRAAFDAKYDAPNGWGNVPDALRFLIACYLGCFYEVPDTVHVWW